MAADTERMLDVAKAENIRLERELAAAHHAMIAAHRVLTAPPGRGLPFPAGSSPAEVAASMLREHVSDAVLRAPLPLDLRADYAAAADRTLAHPLVAEVSEELRLNLSAPARGLEVYGIAKVAHIAAVVSRAQAYRLDPARLTVSGVSRG